MKTRRQQLLICIKDDFHNLLQSQLESKFEDICIAMDASTDGELEIMAAGHHCDDVSIEKA